MANTKVLAVAAVLILVVAAVAVFVVSGDDSSDEGYKSDNTDCRLQILGNADENDYIDSDDVTKLKDMIAKNEFTRIADANNDGKITDADVELVQKIIDTKKANEGKEYKDKTKLKVNYITADEDVVMSGYFPVEKIILINSQRALDIAVGIEIDDMIVALSDTTPWDSNLWAGLEDLPSVGARKEPSLETIVGIDADTIITGNAKNTCKNIPGDTYGSKQVLRLHTWENANIETGALMLGFFTDHDAQAEKYVKFMDDLNKDLQDRLSKVANKEDTSFILMSSANGMSVQKDGVSTALTKTGATNVGNQIVTDVNDTYEKAADHKEDIKLYNPQNIILGVYMPTQWTDQEIADKFNSYDFKPNFEGTEAYDEGNITMISYGMPFPLITLMGAHVLFPDDINESYFKEKLGEYLDNFTNVPEGFEIDMDHYIYSAPAKA